jgi:hypothetical protein
MEPMNNSNTVTIDVSAIMPEMAVTFLTVNAIINALRSRDPELGCMVADLLRSCAADVNNPLIAAKLMEFAGVADHGVERGGMIPSDQHG